MRCYLINEWQIRVDQLQIKCWMLTLPDQDRWLTVASYTQVFMLTLIWNIGIYAIGVALAFIILIILKQYHIRTIKLEKQTRDSLLTYQSGRDSQNTIRTSANQLEEVEGEPNEERVVVVVRERGITGYAVLNFFTSLFFYLTLLAIALLYLTTYMFGYLGDSTGHDILTVSVMFLIVVLPTAIWKYKTRSRVYKEIKTQLAITAVLLVLWLAISILSVIALKGVCICVFNSNYGYRIKDEFMFSTQWLRSQQIDKVCEKEKLCHIYATLPEDTAHSVFINLHTGLDVKNVTVKLTTGAGTITQNLTDPFSMKHLENIGQRNVFHALFTNLTANTMYAVNVTNTDSGKILAITNYRTLPDQGAEEIRMAVGGDVGLEDDARNLTRNLVSFDPHVVILGGDIAYDDGMKTCFYSWDNLYDIFSDELNEKLNRLVPLIMSVGNHDVGFNALADVDFDEDDADQLPNFFVYNPQHLTSDGKIPKPSERESKHLHVIGPSVHLHLDSGYVESYHNQRNFIQLAIKNFPNHYKFANYHNPLYPSCTDSTPGSNDMNVIQEGTKEWTPLFDQGGFVAAFQHHTHHRKITNKIYNNTVSKDNKGVRYIGDGSWGVPEGPCSKKRISKHPEYFLNTEVDKPPNHVWKVRLLKTTETTHSIEYVAVDVSNTQVFSHHDDL